MKKPSLWVGIIGGILVVSNIYSGSQALTHLTDMPLVNVAVITGQALTILVGAFLIFVFLKWKKKEDSDVAAPKPTPDSPEDMALLSIRRNWILAFVLILEFIGSSQTWILNNYTVGITTENFFIVFDLLFNLFFIYIIVELFRNKNANITKILLYTIVIYAVVEGIVAVIWQNWIGVGLDSIFLIYFVLALLMHVTRRNFRLVHLIILPIYLIFSISSGFFSNAYIEDLSKQESLLEQQFVNYSNTLNSAYQIFLQKEKPDIADIQDVHSAYMKRDGNIQQVLDALDILKAEYEAQLPTIKQQENLEQIKYAQELFNLDREQGNKVAELMDYAEKVNFNAITDKQKSDIHTKEQEINDFAPQFTAIQFKMNNSNLNY